MSRNRHIQPAWADIAKSLQDKIPGHEDTLHQVVEQLTRRDFDLFGRLHDLETLIWMGMEACCDSSYVGVGVPGFCEAGALTLGSRVVADQIQDPGSLAPAWDDLGASINVVVPDSGELLVAISGTVDIRGTGSDGVSTVKMGVEFCSVQVESLNFGASTDDNRSLHYTDESFGESAVGKIIYYSGLEPGAATLSLVSTWTSKQGHHDSYSVEHATIALLPTHPPNSDGLTLRTAAIESTNSNTYVDLSTPSPSPSITIGDDGHVLAVHTMSELRREGTTTAHGALDVSGANTIATSDDNGWVSRRGDDGQSAEGGAGPALGLIPFHALDPGSTTFHPEFRVESTVAMGALWADFLALWLLEGTAVDRQVAEVVAEETATSTSYSDLATPGPEVTVNVGASGNLWVLVSADIQSIRGADSNHGRISHALSGANTVAASDVWRMLVESHNSGGDGFKSWFLLYKHTGLSSGSTTVTTKYAVVNSNDDAQFKGRLIAAWVD